ncbi:hypothetical protein [Thorsellia kenyensis]|uniref:Uncharacterized protein n=1 Tax=Thorsellia kenyensis TaxID=1549888 RepID=A0ABV6CCS2_9GAMM
MFKTKKTAKRYSFRAKRMAKRYSMLSFSLLIIATISVEANFDKEYDIKSQATGPLLGHAPGIRTALSVNNLEGSLRVCSKAKVNYQILDLDGDWDRPFMEENREGTQTSIVWWFQLPNSNEKIQVLKSSLGIDPNSRTDQTQIQIPSHIKDAITGNIYPTEGGKLWYQIKPYTALETTPDTSTDFIEAVDVTKAYYLRMAENPGYIDIQEKHEMPINFIQLPFVVPNPNPLSEGIPVVGLVLPSEYSFINSPIIGKANENDCYVDEVFTANITDNQGNLIEDFFVVNGHYQAEVKLNGKNILDTQLIERQIVWHLFSPVEGSSCDINNEEDRKNSECFVSHIYTGDDKNEDGTYRVLHHFNEIGELTYSEFFTQRTNKDAAELIQQTEPNFSEQGFFVGISLINKE